MLNLDQITQDILAQVNQVSESPRFKSTGEIISVGDCIF